MKEILNEDNRRFRKDLKIIIVGNVFTGKTSIINRYMNDIFYPDSRANIDPQFYLKIVKVNNIN